MKIYNSARWKLHRMFYGGWRCVTIKPTMACNYNCPYCAVNFTKGGRVPRFDKTLSPKRWIEILESLGKINVVSVSGGEPMLYKDFLPLANLLLERYYVRIITNLSLEIGLELPKTHRLMIVPTFHESQTTWKDFEKRLKMYKKRFNVLYRQIGKNIELVHNNQERLVLKKQFHPNIAPDGRIFGSCVDLERGGL